MTKRRLFLLLLVLCGCSDDRPRRALEAGELGREATRQMNKEDGAGCLASLDKARERDPQTEAMFAFSRAQCEMLLGQCQAGKRRVNLYLQENDRMSPESRALSVDEVVARWCRGGDSTDRDRLLRALFELSQGAYFSAKDAPFCRERFGLARKLLRQISPVTEPNESLQSAHQTLHITAAHCFVRAGDCPSAFETYTADDSALVRSLRASQLDASVHAKVQLDAFLRSFPGCPSPG